MTAVFRRNTNITRLLHKHSITDPIGAPTLLQSQTQSKAYLRFPQVFRKARDYDLSPSVFSSAFSSSKSSAETTSVSKLGFVGWYLGMLQHRPILTKSVTAALIYTAADLSSQVGQTVIKSSLFGIFWLPILWIGSCFNMVSDESNDIYQTLAKSSFSESYDAVRTLRMAGYGMLVLGPSLHFWFNFMSRVFPKRDIFSTLKKMAMGQTLYGPAMTVVFFSLNACLQGMHKACFFVAHFSCWILFVKVQGLYVLCLKFVQLYILPRFLWINVAFVSQINHVWYIKFLLLSWIWAFLFSCYNLFSKDCILNLWGSN